jgi:cytochrome c oxidase subunit II
MTFTSPNLLAQWMPVRASESAGMVDHLFSFIFWLAAFFVALVVGLLVVFVLRYRHRPGQARRPAPSGNMPLEITWTLIPTIIVIIIFFWGFRAYTQMAIAPPNAYEIQVTGRMWSWSFTYPNGYVDGELHIPANTPVQLILNSNDVIHSLYIPALRLKKDVVPGRYNKLYVNADRLGTYDIYCASYCGTNHSQMTTRLVVHDPDDFVRWLQDASSLLARMTPVEAGEMIYRTRGGCYQCHSIDGSRIKGPSFKNLYGYEQIFTDGSRGVIDENFIRDFVYEPQKRIPAGYDPIMPSFKGTLNEQDVSAIIAYLKSLSDRAPKVSLPGTRPATQPNPRSTIENRK